MEPDPMDFTDAVQAIVHARTRVLRHIPGASRRRAGPLWCWHYDQPICWEQDAFLAQDLPPEAVVAAVRAYGPGAHLIAAYTALPSDQDGAYQRLGYTTVPEEPDERLMARPLALVADDPSAAPSAQVVQQMLVQQVGPGDLQPVCADPAMEPLPPWLADDPDLHGYIVRAGEAVISKGIMSIHQQTAYIGGLFTHPAHRRQGAAAAVLARMHRDAAGAGCTAAVLVAMPVAVSLYRTCGYAAVGHVRKFVPQGWAPPWR